MLCETLKTIDEEELSQLIRLPFNYMPKEELKQIFTKVEDGSLFMGR
ncbi:hypothetical protein [Aquimarina sp. BL5]|nr:hypothetical protein [Aquimarina sp. BL5]